MSTIKQDLYTETGNYQIQLFTDYATLPSSVFYGEGAQTDWTWTRNNFEGIATRMLTNSDGQTDTLIMKFGDVAESPLTSKNNMPSSKCKVQINGYYSVIGKSTRGQWSGGSDFPIYFTIRYKKDTGSLLTRTPIRQSFTVPTGGYPQNTTQVFFPDLTVGDTFVNDILCDVRGSDTVGGAVNELSNLYYDIQIGSDNTGGIYNNFLISIQGELSSSPQFRGTFTRSWEGNVYNIDGLEGDDPPIISTQSIFTVSGGIIRDSISNPTAQFTITEDSVSVITGVNETLQTNFIVSAAAKVEHFATKTLIQETELLGTVFNFRFMDPLSIQSQNTVSIAGSIIKNLASALSLSNITTASFTGNLIYDISKEYQWGDFGIVGYFITGYSTPGYAADSSEYSWDELGTDPWDSWTYTFWQGLETGWDQWPEDVWNSTRTLQTDFNFVEIGRMIRGGVSQLLSTTALSEDAAFRIEGTPGTIRSDFLCDGSPAGKIGGFSTMVSDAVLTALGNYIVNNAQNIDGAFNATLLANYIVQFLWQAQSDFSLAVSPTFKPGGVTNAQCIAIVNALANYKINNAQNIDGAFDTELVARIFFTTDPYNIHKILQETRQIFVDAESRGIEIPQEIRLNSIPAENRAFLVPQETRNMKLRIPPMTNRFTTPKIRTE
jgi:hypothetical protein